MHLVYPPPPPPPSSSWFFRVFYLSSTMQALPTAPAQRRAAAGVRGRFGDIWSHLHTKGFRERERERTKQGHSGKESLASMSAHLSGINAHRYSCRHWKPLVLTLANKFVCGVADHLLLWLSAPSHTVSSYTNVVICLFGFLRRVAIWVRRA